MEKNTRVLAAVKDTSSISREVVHISSLFAKARKGELLIVNVCEVPLSLPLDQLLPGQLESAQKILDGLIKIAEDTGVNVETHLLQARTPGAGILSEIKAVDPDLLVLGAKRETEPGSAPEYSTTAYVLKHAPCRALLVVGPQEEKAPHDP